MEVQRSITLPQKSGGTGNIDLPVDVPAGYNLIGVLRYNLGAGKVHAQTVGTSGNDVFLSVTNWGTSTSATVSATVLLSKSHSLE